VLLAEPKLFPDVKKVLSPKDFDVPVLSQIAEALFGILAEKPGATVGDICGCVEDTRVAGLVTELEIVSAKKGNFKKRLDDALADIEKDRRQKNQETLKPVQDRFSMGLT
jgi:hypothetical protein